MPAYVVLNGSRAADQGNFAPAMLCPQFAPTETAPGESGSRKGSIVGKRAADLQHMVAKNAAARPLLARAMHVAPLPGNTSYSPDTSRYQHRDNCFMPCNGPKGFAYPAT